jgi:hypothetical protein
MNMKTQVGLAVVLLGTAAAVVAFAQAETIDGKWEATTGDGKVTMDLKADGKALKGTVTVGGKSFTVDDGELIDSDTVSFAWTTAFPPMGNPVRRAAVAKLSGDEMLLAIKVKIESTGAESLESMTLKRSRQASVEPRARPNSPALRQRRT